MRFRLLALLSVFAALCLSAGAQAPAGFIPVSGTQLVDSNGIPIANAALCAQATIAGQPASIHVGGGGNTTMSQVCTNVVNGHFSISLPNVSISVPRYACLKLTATDNVSGASLLSGYNCVQPRSTPILNAADQWCSASACNFDLLPPNYPASDVFVAPQGPQGPAVVVTNGGVSGDYYVSGQLTDGNGGPPNSPAPLTPTQLANKMFVDSTRGGVWTRIGTVIRGDGDSQFAAQEATVLYEGNAALLPSPPGNNQNVFKAWYVCGWTVEGLCYAESYDGIAWTHRTAPVIASPASVAHGFVMHDGGQYVFYAASGGSGAGRIDRYTSPDGLNWTLANTGVLTLGTGSAWDSGSMGNVYIVHEGSTYYMVYEASGTTTDLYVSGVATSPDGINWTKYAGNPVITGPNGGAAGGPQLFHINGTWFMWGQCSAQHTNQPTDICRWSSPDFYHWTLFGNGPVFARSTYDEGVDRTDNLGGQVADPTMVEANGRVYMWYSAIRTQNVPTAYNDGSHLKLAIAPMPLAALVTTTEGSTGDIASGDTAFSPDFYRAGYFGIPVEDDDGERAIGDVTITGGTFPQICLNCYFNVKPTPAVSSYVADGIAAKLTLDKNGTTGVLQVFPAGVAGQPLGTGNDIFVFDASGLKISKLSDYFGVTRATGVGCAAAAGGTCGAVVTLNQPFPGGVTPGYKVYGCTLEDGISGTTVTNRITGKSPTEFVVDEIAGTGGATGGTVNCIVMAN